MCSQCRLDVDPHPVTEELVDPLVVGAGERLYMGDEPVVAGAHPRADPLVAARGVCLMLEQQHAGRALRVRRRTRRDFQ
jgi:hypothetical protein